MAMATEHTAMATAMAMVAVTAEATAMEAVMAMVMAMVMATATVAMEILRWKISRCGRGYWVGKKKPESRSQSPDKKLDLDNCLHQYESRNTHNKNKFHLDSRLFQPINKQKPPVTIF